MEGLDQLWFVGDNFLATMYRQHFKLARKDFYSKLLFEVTAKCKSRFSSKNTNMLSRIQNAGAEAINKNITLPKYMVIILDNDLINYLNYSNLGISLMYGSWIEWLAKTLNEMIIERKRQLPRKAVIPDEPFIYWAMLPYHKNLEGPKNICRNKFNKCLEAVMKLYQNM